RPDAIGQAPRQIHMPLDEQIGEDERYFRSEKLADTRPSPEDECRNSELAARLRKCTALLSPSLRRTFQLRVADGLSIFETTQVWGVPQGTVKAQVARTKKPCAVNAVSCRTTIAYASVRVPHEPSAECDLDSRLAGR